MLQEKKFKFWFIFIWSYAKTFLCIAKACCELACSGGPSAQGVRDRCLAPGGGELGRYSLAGGEE